MTMIMKSKLYNRLKTHQWNAGTSADGTPHLVRTCPEVGMRSVIAREIEDIQTFRAQYAIEKATLLMESTRRGLAAA